MTHAPAKGNKGSNGGAVALPPGWQSPWLKDICELNPRRPPIERRDEALTTFVPMPAVAEAGAGITRPELRPFREIRKGYTYFGEGDVLFAKITPCMENGKHAIARNLTDGIGFGSTEFHVLRPGTSVLAEWIHYFILQPWVIQQATAHFAGTVGQQRVPEDYLADLPIPLAPLPEQRRIAARLRELLAAVADANDAAQAQEEASQLLSRAKLRAVFESSRAAEWPRKPLEAIVLRPLRTGLSKPGHSSSTARCLTLSAVRNGVLDLTASKPTEITEDEAKANVVRPGVFYVVRGNGNIKLVARGALAPDPVPQPVLFPDLLIEVECNPAIVQAHFLRWVWDSPQVRKALEARSMTSAGIYKINLGNLSTVEIPVPPIAQQRAIAQECQALANQLSTFAQHSAARKVALDHLPAALLREAFAGRL